MVLHAMVALRVASRLPGGTKATKLDTTRQLGLHQWPEERGWRKNLGNLNLTVAAVAHQEKVKLVSSDWHTCTKDVDTRIIDTACSTVAAAIAP